MSSSFKSSFCPSMIAKRNIEKSQDEIRLLKEMKKKFKTTNISELRFIDLKDAKVSKKFSDFYEYKYSLGAGSFGFVVAAKDLETQELLALKVSTSLGLQ